MWTLDTVGATSFNVTIVGDASGAEKQPAINAMMIQTGEGTLPSAASVVERHVAYNNSVFDGNDAAADASDDTQPSQLTSIRCRSLKLQPLQTTPAMCEALTR